MTGRFISKATKLQNWIIPVIVTAIFAFRWQTCLPLSGYMPSITENTDQLDVWARYVLWAREPFAWPVSVIHGLNFPFFDASITRGPLPFFALIFKGLARINGVFYDFYYFPFVEMVFVFFSAYFTCLLLDSFQAKNFLLKLTGAVLTGLSFPLLYRSSIYYGVTYFVSYVPLYLGFAYFYKRLYDRSDKRSLHMFLAFMIIATSMFEHYVLFGIYFLLLICVICCVINCLYNNNKINILRLKSSAIILTLSVIATLSVVYILGKQGDIDINVTSSVSLLNGRNDMGWGYGGGFGGGFHVADVLTLIIPPQYRPELPAYLWCGPGAILTKMGFPLTQNNLQNGQYEGFSYLGTAVILMGLVVIIAGILLLVKNRKAYLCKMKILYGSSLVMKNELFRYPAMMCLASFLLFVLSWGYIIHVAGIRFNAIVTPSLILATIWPKFMFLRSMGRLALPFMLFVSFTVIAVFGWMLQKVTAKQKKVGRYIFGVAMIMIIVFHVYEIRGYLQPPKAVIHGNQLANAFGESDISLIEEVTKDKKAIIVVPPIRQNDRWLVMCYSLAYVAKVPINGYYSGLGVNPEHIRQNALDTEDVMSGKIGSIVTRYGNLAIAAPPHIAEKIMRLADMPLVLHRMKHEGVALMTLRSLSGQTDR